MHVWLAIIAGSLFAYIAIVVVAALLGHARSDPRLSRFLSERDVSFVAVRYAGQYGWPDYAVVFASVEEPATFRRSAVFDDLLEEVQSRHARVRSRWDRFDASRAVTLYPIGFADGGVLDWPKDEPRPVFRPPPKSSIDDYFFS